tara:strand:+ start:383 stop:703 length:321 start_codon:yes stop_codon:yes gene_type:complete
MERYLYFSEATVETTGENAMYPLASFRGMTPSGGAATNLHFESRNGAITDDIVNIAHTGKTFKEFAQFMAHAMQRNHRNPVLVIKDGPNKVRAFDDIGVNAITTEA